MRTCVSLSVRLVYEVKEGKELFVCGLEETQEGEEKGEVLFFRRGCVYRGQECGLRLNCKWVSGLLMAGSVYCALLQSEIYSGD